ncbi:MAG: diguanylate cyclase [Phycisphaerae bacterium]
MVRSIGIKALRKQTSEIPDAAESPSLLQLLRFTRSLQFKATVLVVALTLGVTAVVTSYFLQVSLRISQEEYARQLRDSASMLATTLGYGWDRYDPRDFQRLIDASVSEGPLDFVRITNAKGTPRAVAAKDGHEGLLCDVSLSPETTKLLGQPRSYPSGAQLPTHMTLVYPIRGSLHDSDGNKDGTVRLLGYLSTGMTVNRWQRTMASRVDLLTGVGMMAGTMAIILGFILIRRIVSPLDHVAANMDQFSKGKLSARSNIKRGDEIGKLAVAFNRMADEHQRTLESLVNLNAELEERVADRTKQLQELASRDPLTGVYNRRHFNEVFEQHVSQAIRYEHDLACIMIDIDNFKRVNDQYGHDKGDRLLELVAHTIESNLRKSDMCARYGGDEFIVVLPETDIAHAASLGERVLQELREQTGVLFTEFEAAISIGITSLRSIHADSANEILVAADRAMYDAKEAGKGRMVTTAGA